MTQRNVNGQPKLTWRWILTQSAAGSLLLWAAFPPLGLSALAWVAPSFWAFLAIPRELPRRSYAAIWATAAVCWFALLEGVGRAFWANYLGLVILSSYLAIYQVLFIALTRVAVQRWRLSVVFAAPVVWTGLELARGYGAAGFSAALLGHTQADWTSLIQLADVFGAYGISFLVMLVAASLARMVPSTDRRWTYWPTALIAVAFGAALFYGQPRAPTRLHDSQPITVALLQGTEDTRFDQDYTVTQQRSIETFEQYWRLALEAKSQRPDLDVIVWPEGMFTAGLSELIAEGDITAPPEAAFRSEAEFRGLVEKRIDSFREKARIAAQTFNQPTADEGSPSATYLVVGTDSVHLAGSQQRIYNSALLITPSGTIASRYYKIHRVMFGEYIPLGEYWPWLYDWVPIGRGLTPGARPRAFDILGVRFVPSICFEITVPHLIRRQVVELTAAGEPPDVLLNLTNDGWFWGSSILDLHLACGVFRAVELRRPLLIAANTGLSAWIDERGAVRQSLPRRQEGFLVADVEVPVAAPRSLYEQYGDWAAQFCLGFCVLLAVSSACAPRTTA